MSIVEKIFGNYSEKEIKRLKPIINKIDAQEAELEKLTDEQLRAKTDEFKKRIQDGESLDSIMPDAYAVVREASKRVLGMRHYEVQLVGGIILHQGRISEMKTGEGKTLVSTLPAYLNALEGKGVHIVTVNDYLAKRDAEEMGRVHSFLGLTVGVVLNSMQEHERQEAYNCDITYATNNELGFDYLRDNMVVYKSKMVQRPLNYAIIDEVDSVLIDEARTPLIISGAGNKSSKLYEQANFFVKTLEKGRIVNEDHAMNALYREELQEEGDFVYDEKAKSVNLTAQGMQKAEKYFGVDSLSDINNMELQHYINNALKANNAMILDRDYVIQDGEIVIVDEFTGRLMPGRRYSDGLHQAIEAKEKVEVKKESKTLATVTFQNYFNKYPKKAGMTGTAKTEDTEFRQIYGMDVVEIPTNRPVIRKDETDVVYRTEAGKFRAVIRSIKESYEKGQPVLVGTVSIEKSEQLSELLKREHIPHQVLNAKYHEKEAEIVAQAGARGQITIATNMAGRGTDIKLGEGVPEIGGLKIIGTERHESRRIDNQLRGRAGRQGDPGESRFYISLEDDLMRLFGAEKVTKLIDAMGMDEDEAIEHKMLTKSIEGAQKRVEGNNFAIRKHLLDYDTVMNEQREVIYGERMRVLEGENLKPHLLEMYRNIVEEDVNLYTNGSEYPEEWDIDGLNEYFNNVFKRNIINRDHEDFDKLTKESMEQYIYDKGEELYNDIEQEFIEKESTDSSFREMERVIFLRVIDQKWVEHIDDMEQMRQGIGLRAHAQKDPLMEYKFASYDMFDDLIHNIKLDTLKMVFSIRPREAQELERRQVANVIFTNKSDDSVKKQPAKAQGKIGRNDPCICGSGKKYKHCCENRA